VKTDDRHQRAVQEGLEESAATFDPMVDGLSDAVRRGGRILLFGEGRLHELARYLAPEVLGRRHKNGLQLPVDILDTSSGEPLQAARRVGPFDAILAVAAGAEDPLFMGVLEAAKARGARIYCVCTSRARVEGKVTVAVDAFEARPHYLPGHVTLILHFVGKRTLGVLGANPLIKPTRLDDGPPRPLAHAATGASVQGGSGISASTSGTHPSLPRLERREAERAPVEKAAPETPAAAILALPPTEPAPRGSAGSTLSDATTRAMPPVTPSAIIGVSDQVLLASSASAPTPYPGGLGAQTPLPGGARGAASGRTPTIMPPRKSGVTPTHPSLGQRLPSEVSPTGVIGEGSQRGLPGEGSQRGVIVGEGSQSGRLRIVTLPPPSPLPPSSRAPEPSKAPEPPPAPAAAAAPATAPAPALAPPPPEAKKAAPTSSSDRIITADSGRHRAPTSKDTAELVIDLEPDDADIRLVSENAGALVDGARSHLVTDESPPSLPPPVARDDEGRVQLIQFRCKDCREPVLADPGEAGRRARCPFCGRRVKVPRHGGRAYRQVDASISQDAKPVSLQFSLDACKLSITIPGVDNERIPAKIEDVSPEGIDATVDAALASRLVLGARVELAIETPAFLEPLILPAVVERVLAPLPGPDGTLEGRARALLPIADGAPREVSQKLARLCELRTTASAGAAPVAAKPLALEEAQHEGE